MATLAGSSQSYPRNSGLRLFYDGALGDNTETDAA
jgi:hypothetical protein